MSLCISLLQEEVWVEPGEELLTSASNTLGGWMRGERKEKGMPL